VALSPHGLVSEKLIEQVSPTWWYSEEGQRFLEKQQLRQEWASFLGRFHFDVWFTLTFKNPANSGGLAIARTARLLRKAFKGVGIEGDNLAFVVAEEHRLGGMYHTHGMMRLDALDKQFEDTFLRYFHRVAFELYGRNRFSRIACNDSVRYYVSKYITKRVADWLII
jgi:hypothetical protein